jgi:hypothetical protein
MKIFEVIKTQEDNADVDLTPTPGSPMNFNRGKAETGIISVPDKIKDDPAAQAAPIVQKGLELPADHPWNYLHSDPNVDLPATPRGKPVARLRST